MKRTESSSSLQPPSSRHGILSVPVCRLRPHPANANVMEEDRLEKLAENMTTLIQELLRARPSSAKGRYILSAHVSSTMGPSVRVDPSSVTVAA